jgi:sodium transport system permease protein
MRWSIIRLIWLRELRDQLRDRRTVFMITVLPLLIYPVLGMGVLSFALGSSNKPAVVGVVGSAELPQLGPRSSGFSPLPVVAGWFSLPPPGPAAPGATAERLAAAVLLTCLGAQGLGQDLPPLLLVEGQTVSFPQAYLDPDADAPLQVKLLGGLPPAPAGEFETGPPGEAWPAWLEGIDRGPLRRREVDLLLVVSPGFRDQLRSDGRPALYLLTRPEDDRSSAATRDRVQGVLSRWRKRITETRLLNHGLPAQFDEGFAVREGDQAGGGKKAAPTLFDALVRIFPFLLVVWALTGALYPAVDLCAGEKERGTMETLLISPASREEIVYGKFLTIWVFSGATALLNLLSIGLTTWRYSGLLPAASLRPVALLWCVLLVLPLSAFFSALCLAIGAYARSSKEGQYYLMPLFLVTMPLIFLTLAPGVELNAFYSMIPVTGVALLLQRLMTATAPDQVPWAFFVPVLGPMVLYGWLSLRWAVYQFQREEVLFREAERLDLALWFRRLLRDKEAIPSFGQALFCFAVLVGLHWLSLGLGDRIEDRAVRTCISALAFVAAPAAILAVMLTSRPVESLGLRVPALRNLGTAVLLAVLLLPLSELGLLLVGRFPPVKESLQGTQPLTGELLRLHDGTAAGAWWGYLLLFLPALCQELAFRGFILTGLRRRFHPLTAIVLSSLLYALFSLNVFEAVPAFGLGLVLGVLATRSGSVLPGMLFHLVHGGLLLGVGMQRGIDLLSGPPVVAVCTLLAAAVVIAAAYRHLAPVWASKDSAPG